MPLRHIRNPYGVDYLTANAHGYEMLSNVVIREDTKTYRTDSTERC